MNARRQVGGRTARIGGPAGLRLSNSLCLCTGILAALLVFWRPAAAGFGQGEERMHSREYDVKAAFLLNFTKFIEWPPPEQPDRPFMICIFGEDPFAGVLDKLVSGETVNGRKLVVSRVGEERPAGCQIVFMDHAAKEVRRVLSSLGPGVLTVGEGDEFLHQGGMIAFIIEDRHVRFDINQKAAGTAALKFSSKLLSVARTVDK